MDVLNKIESVMLLGGFAIGISNMETIVGLIYLIIQVCILITKIVLALYNKLKHNDIEGAIDVLEEGQEKLEDLLTDEKESDKDV